MTSSEFKNHLVKAASGEPLTAHDASAAFEIILQGGATDVQVAAFVACLHVRGETSLELATASELLRARALRVEAPADAIDIVGTGGDGLDTLNISTASAIVAAACGVVVAKHGNRAQSSRCGSADVLGELGLNLALTPLQIGQCISTVGLGFMFAPNHHSALAHVAGVRKQLGFRTIFNLLGPLCNPAMVNRQLVGVFAEKWLIPFADALKSLGSKRAWIVHGEDGLDEISVTGSTRVAELNGGHVRQFTISPADAGLSVHSMASIVGGDAKANAQAMLRLLEGELGAFRDAVCINVAAALIVAEKVKSLREGVEVAVQALNSGAARRTLENLVRFSSAQSKNILQHISAYKHEEIRVSRLHRPLREVEASAKLAPAVRGFGAALRTKVADDQFALIAEVKKASPSKGLIRVNFDPPAIARAYEQGGAACLSVLTDSPSFQGKNEYLSQARVATNLPVLRKDFMFDPYQVIEARSLGADCILVIMAAVSDEQARDLCSSAVEWGMDVLVEVHDRNELERALQLSPSIIGINNRNLNSFETRLETTEELAQYIPENVTVVAESGINSHTDIVRLAKSGVSVFLVGESLMRQDDIEVATRSLLGAST